MQHIVCLHQKRPPPRRRPRQRNIQQPLPLQPPRLHPGLLRLAAERWVDNMAPPCHRDSDTYPHDLLDRRVVHVSALE